MLRNSRKAQAALIGTITLAGIAFTILNKHLGIALPPLIQLTAALICVCLAIYFAYERFRFASSADIPVETPTLEQREAVEARLAAVDQSDDTQAALFVLEQSKASYDAVVASNITLEAKASSLLTMIAGAAGLLSLFGRFKDGVAQASSLFLWVAIGAAVVALLSCLYILRTKVRPFPSVAAYVLPRIVWDDNSCFQIALELAESYNGDIIFLRRDRRYEGAAYYTAQIFVALAALALLAHFAIPPLSTSPKSLITCRVAAEPQPMIFSLSCMEKS
jgi:hypothetical protein